MKATLGCGEGVAVEALDDILVAVPPVNQQVILSKKLCSDINLYILTIQPVCQIIAHTNTLAVHAGPHFLNRFRGRNKFTWGHIFPIQRASSKVMRSSQNL